MPSSVLVVEDYADLRSAISDMLARYEVGCETVRSPEDAIVKLRAHHYEAILLSPRLPITTDPVMCFLHETQPDELRKVILMTEAEEEDADDCRVLRKPFGGEQLVKTLVE